MVIMKNTNCGGAKDYKNNVSSKHFFSVRNLRSITIFVNDCDAYIIYNFILTSCSILLIKTEAVVVKIYKYLYVITVAVRG